MMNSDSTTPEILTHFQSYVDGIRERYNPPALSVALWYNDTLYQAASGCLNINTGVEATTDSIFQIASITKVFTASLIVQLIEEGRVELDAPVKRYLRDFQVADPDLSETITVGQLLDHTSGIPGDYFGNHSYTEQDAIARYVDRCNWLGSIHAPGERYSYSNAAYNIAGRMIEVVLGITWFDAIEERIIKPLGMTHSVVHPSQVIKYRVAMGHEPDPKNKDRWQLASACYFPIGTAPCGAVMTMSASDLIKFARVHLEEGRAESGKQWLSPKSIKNMQQQRISLPPHSYMFGTGWGLGWQRIDVGKTTIIGHGGGSLGQKSMLHLLPENNIAIAALHNSNNGNLLPDLLRELVFELVDITLPVVEPTESIPSPSELEKLLGVYETIATTITITLVDGELTATMVEKFIAPRITTRYRLKFIENNSFATYSETGERGLSITFLDLDERNHPKTLYCLGRIATKTVTNKEFLYVR